jgi:hypothetical protein
MTLAFAIRASLAALAMTAPVAALAQAGPMSEVIGQPIQVTTNGVTNTLYFDPDGTVRMITPNASVVQGNWAIQGSNLCVSRGAVSECFPYNSPFQAQQPRTMTSSCNSVSTWLAQATNGPSMDTKAERGN